MTHVDLPGRDRRAVLHQAPGGKYRLTEDRHVAVVGGGIAGLAAAIVLAERGARVTLVEADDRLGGRVAAWPLDDDRTMSRGFHAFFRQYYNLRSLIRRADPEQERLVPVDDYPLQRPDGMRDSFSNIPRTPPWSILGFVIASPSFSLRSLSKVDFAAALELVRVRFPRTFSDHDGESAAEFLDRLNFPADARDLALEVFARSFFADPTQFSAGELVAMFHTYFLGSAEGLVFDVPDDDYDTALWAPLGGLLQELGGELRLSTRATALEVRDDGATVTLDDGGALETDALVLATDPRTSRELVGGMEAEGGGPWRDAVAATENAPPFVVVRLWFDGLVAPERPAFIATSGYGPLDNVSVLERFEAGAARWTDEHGGSVVELHAYACDDDVLHDPTSMVEELERQMHRIFPETASLDVRHREVLVRDDCTLIGPHRWADRPGVETPWESLVMAGDWVRCDYPVALMERAATTGYLAANRLLERWGVRGQDIWTTPMRGLIPF